MLKQRLLVTAVLLPVGLITIAYGGPYYYALVSLILGLAAWEYAKLFQVGGYHPSGVFVVIGTLALTANRYFYGLQGDPFMGDSWTLGLLILIGMIIHLIDYERGGQGSGTDFAITISGIFYVGFLGSYLIPLRALPDGVWWVLTVLPAVWLADSGAYFIGRQFGRHKLSPRLSPKKTWEGYIGGLVVGPLLTIAFVYLWQQIAGEPIAVTVPRALVIGLIMAIVPTLGDLGESMIKRQVGVKDSSSLLPGHGGAFDRIDSWLWAGILGYYVIVWFF